MYTIAIVGRPNVGKSALFNRIIGRRKAIIEDIEGVTRDRLYEKTEVFGKEVCFIDTGGIDYRDTIMFSQEIRKQTLLALEEADAIIFVVDGTSNITIQDEEVSRLLLKTNKPVVLAVNKIDNFLIDISEYYRLGIRDVFGVSAIHGNGVADMLVCITEGTDVIKEVEEIYEFEEEDDDEDFDEESFEEEEEVIQEKPKGMPRVAIVGRTNVGKSTLMNFIVGEERCVVSPIPGTTRDAIDVVSHEIVFIDTAGLRKKSKEHETVDKFATIRTQKTIERCDLCVVVIDVNEGLTAYEKTILQTIEEQGKGCILFLNKWDLTSDLRMEHAILALKEANAFLSEIPIVVGSAKTGRHVDDLLKQIHIVYESQTLKITTGELNTFVEKAVQQNHPPMIQGKRLRIFYLTQIGSSPPSFILFVNNSKLFVDSYKRYLINQLRLTYHFTGCPIRFKIQSRKSAKFHMKHVNH